jgi:hypothetical protein
MISPVVTASVRSVAHRYDWTVAKPHSEKRQRSVMFSVRFTPDEGAEIRECAARSGRTVGDILREGVRYPLERQRTEWLERHRGDPEVWGEVTAIQAGPPRDLKPVFGVRLTSEQMRDILPAAEAWDLPLSAFMREAALRVAAAMTHGGDARCQHFSVGRVTSAECPECGPLPVAYAVVA